MNYNEFEKLYRDDPVTFCLAIEIFMENGRDIIESLSDQELGAEVARQVSSYFSNGKINENVKAVKDFAALKNMDLLSYISRCGIKLEGELTDEPGVCPLCGGKLDYGEDASADKPHVVGWICQECLATGKEAYREVFDCHYDVRDSGGRLIVNRNQNK